MGAAPATAILWPAVAMAGLTFLVWVRLYQLRLGEMARKRIRAQALASAADSVRLLSDTRASDNFRNLFELPVLFYFALVVAAISGQTGPLVVGLAWAYVAARIAHSVIQCTYNRVMHRFRAFAASVFVLLALWCVLGYGLLVP